MAPTPRAGFHHATRPDPPGSAWPFDVVVVDDGIPDGDVVRADVDLADDVRGVALLVGPVVGHGPRAVPRRVPLPLHGLDLVVELGAPAAAPGAERRVRDVVVALAVHDGAVLVVEPRGTSGHQPEVLPSNVLALELEVRPVVPEEHAAVPDRDDSIAPRASDLHVGVAVGADPEVTPDASQVPAAVP